MELLHETFDTQVRADPSAEVARDAEGRIFTRQELHDRSEGVAHALASRGLGKGDRIAVLAMNSLDYLSCYLGVARAGAVIVPMNYRLAPKECVYIANDAGARVIIAGDEHVQLVDDLRREIPSLEHLVALDGQGPPGWTAFEDWISSGAEGPGPAIDPDDDLVQMYTSGTTGLPKGALLTQEAVALLSGRITENKTMEPGGRLLVATPVYHIGGATIVFQALATGGSVYMLRTFTPDEVIRVLDEEGITFTFFAPSMIRMLLDVPGVEQREYKTLRSMAYASAPIGEHTLREAMKAFRCPFTQGYGMTEQSLLTNLSPADHDRALSGEKPELLRSCGKPVPDVRIKILDEHGNPVGPGEVGEIVAMAPGNMRGYWGLPEATAAALKDGWLYTGDAGCLDDEGYLYIQDRIKDMIISGGENIYPAEIENALEAHPAVAEVAVIGVPDEKWGENVHAVVVLRSDAHATPEELIGFCREHLAGYKCPKSVEFVDELPRNASMKVLKNELRRPHWKSRERAV